MSSDATPAAPAPSTASAEPMTPAEIEEFLHLVVARNLSLAQIDRLGELTVRYNTSVANQKD